MRLAFAFDMPLALITAGFIYLVEALSDIIQVVYFKLSHGKRVFKMAPIHHHFEKSGWKEKKLFAVFTLVSAAFVFITWMGIKNRYGL
jgi:phospho-N-acetylmuramoyl-pentapeptide-transferase